MDDGFGTIKDGYFVPHSHVVKLCACGRMLLLPVGATDPREAIAAAHASPGAASTRSCCS